MKSLIPAFGALLLLSAPCSAAPKPKAEGKLSKADFEGGAADTTTIRLVQYFLETETADLAPETVPHFMRVDPATLPPKLRGPYWAKKEELMALQKISAGKKKPPLRRIGQEEEPKCEIEKGTPQQVGVLKQAGFQPIEENEVLGLMQKTSCTECELQTEFTLKILVMPLPKDAKPDQKPKRVYMLFENDPVWAVISMLREGQAPGTSFFGIGGFPKCR